MAESTLQHQDDMDRVFIPVAFIERPDPSGIECSDVPIDVAIVHAKKTPTRGADTWIFVAQIGRSCECACAECENCESASNPANGLAVPLSSIGPLIDALTEAMRTAEGQ